MYDLQGLEVKSTGKNWTFTEYFNVMKANDYECDADGYLFRIFKILEKKYNFTFVTRSNSLDSWGLQPVSGPFNLSGQWEGIMGDVIMGKYPLSINAWIWGAERNKVLDFVRTSNNYQVLVMQPQHLNYDLNFFIRPFNTNSWLAGTGTVLIMCACFLLPSFMDKKFNQSLGHMITIVSALYLYLLVYSFYCGALTMFFANSFQNPFSNDADIIEAFPTWKLILREGMLCWKKIELKKD